MVRMVGQHMGVHVPCTQQGFLSPRTRVSGPALGDSVSFLWQTVFILAAIVIVVRGTVAFTSLLATLILFFSGSGAVPTSTPTIVSAS